MLIIALGLLFVFFTGFLFPRYHAEISQVATVEVNSLDARFSYVQADVIALFKTVKAEGRQKMKFISGVIDMMYPLVYGLLFWLLLAQLTDGLANQKLRAVRFLPLVAVLFDYTENFSVLNMLQTFPSISEGQVMMSSLATSSKWVCLGLTLLLVVVLVLYRLYRHQKKPAF